MPEWLATKPTTTTCHYKGITSPPSNYTKWGNVIEEMATHLLARCVHVPRCSLPYASTSPGS